MRAAWKRTMVLLLAATAGCSTSGWYAVRTDVYRAAMAAPWDLGIPARRVEDNQVVFVRRSAIVPGSPRTGPDQVKLEARRVSGAKVAAGVLLGLGGAVAVGSLPLFAVSSTEGDPLRLAAGAHLLGAMALSSGVVLGLVGLGLRVVAEGHPAQEVRGGRLPRITMLPEAAAGERAPAPPGAGSAP